ncbi:hypothetical protein [Streptomyces sp. H27-C3]|uniref:hypothetical protein n=1 Tax=Streptomyces sp. H27-C3 TaxID=3046305 RepID=UPI0024BAC89D|nr:hypothetical protein [Streptomyces sp. H27-C3]MDJ0461771.1 hypothetical protein [Streptomyces sp. H27-C3]
MDIRGAGRPAALLLAGVLALTGCGSLVVPDGEGEPSPTPTPGGKARKFPLEDEMRILDEFTVTAWHTAP